VPRRRDRLRVPRHLTTTCRLHDRPRAGAARGIRERGHAAWALAVHTRRGDRRGPRALGSVATSMGAAFIGEGLVPPAWSRSFNTRRRGVHPADEQCSDSPSSTAPGRPGLPNQGSRGPQGRPAGAPGATRPRKPPAAVAAPPPAIRCARPPGSLRSPPVARPRPCSNSICAFFPGMTSIRSCPHRSSDTAEPSGGPFVIAAVRGWSSCELVAAGQHQTE
jgi:hypothetical protein